MRRRLLIAAIFLLAGAIVNVGVAWGCVIWSPLRWPELPRGAAPADQAWWKAHVRAGITSEPILSVITETFGSDYRLLTAARDDMGINVRLELSDDSLDWRMSLTYSPTGPSQRQPWDQSLRVRAGWPVRSLAGERWRAAAPVNDFPPKQHFLTLSPGREVVHVAAYSIQRSTASGTQYRLAPLRPLWPGFAVNTLFYATILWLVIPGSFVLRRFLRVRRGLCPKCAYPMGESAVCSECGRMLPRRVRAMT